MDLSSALLISSMEYKTLLKERIKSATTKNYVDNNNSQEIDKQQRLYDEDNNIKNCEDVEATPRFVHSWRRHLDKGLKSTNSSNKNNINNEASSRGSSLPSYNNHNHNNDFDDFLLNNLTLNEKKKQMKINDDQNYTMNWYKEFRDKEHDSTSWNLLIETDDDKIFNENKPKSPIKSPTRSSIRLFQNASSTSISPKRNLFEDKAIKKFNNILMNRYFQSLKLKAFAKKTSRIQAADYLTILKKKRAFRDWCDVYHASVLSEKVRQRKLWKCLCIWNQNSLKSKRLSDAMYNYAEQHYRMRWNRILMNKAKLLLSIKNNMRDRKSKNSIALNFRNGKLLNNTLSVWKYQAKKLIKEKLSREEHLQRLERIKKLVNTISTSKNTAVGQKHNSVNNIEDVEMNISSDKEQRILCDQGDLDASSKDTKSVGNYEQNGNLEDETELLAHGKDFIQDRVEAKRSLQGSKMVRPVSRTLNVSSNNIARQQEQQQRQQQQQQQQREPSNVVEKQKIYPTKEELEIRAIERKKRAVELRKQAEERVYKRQRDEEHVKSSKLQVEEETLNKLREERRIKLEKEKVLSVRNKEMQLELQRKLDTATKFHNTQLLMRLGFVPFCRLLEIKKLNSLKAANFRDDYLLQSSWIALYGYVMMLKNERIRREYRASAFAVAHFRRSLLKKTWKSWSLYRKLLKAKAKAVTGHFSRFSIVRRAYKAWRLTLERVRRKNILKLRAVEPRGDKCTIKFYWKRWYEYLQQSLVEREISNRADLTWNKVQKWLS